jgi:chromosome partitioning protein
MAKIIAVANQKGGVGKTTTSVNLAASLVSIGYRVLLVDLDAQGNATMGCGVDKHQVQSSAYEILTGKAFIQDALLAVDQDGLDLLPGNSDLTAVQVELMDRIGRERVLSESLAVCREDYHFIIIDCPPALNILTLNALVSADSVLIPMQCEYYALEGLSDLMDTLQNVQEMVNPGLHIEGLLRTMYDSRSRLTSEVSAQLLEHFREHVLDTIVPRNVRLAEAPSHGQSIVKYDKGSKGAQAYLALAEEIIRRNQS